MRTLAIVYVGLARLMIDVVIALQNCDCNKLDLGAIVFPRSALGYGQIKRHKTISIRSSLVRSECLDHWIFKVCIHLPCKVTDIWFFGAARICHRGTSLHMIDPVVWYSDM